MSSDRPSTLAAEPLDEGLVERCRQIHIIISDVDGVLTLGRVSFNAEGVEVNGFHIRDGLGIKLWQKAGYEFGIITGRNSSVTAKRAADLAIPLLSMGHFDKKPELARMLNEKKIEPIACCYLGDDLPDLPLIERVGLGVAVADAASEVKAAAHYVTRLSGGCGAVREVIEMILKVQNKWAPLVEEIRGNA